jgi:DNA primase
LLSTRFPDLQRITLFFDGDVAGVTTSRRMSDQLSEVNKVYLAYCPEGKDPDDLKGRDAFLAPVVAAKPVLPRPKAN